MAHPEGGAGAPTSAPRLLQVKEILRNELIAILDTIRGSKALVLDKDLSGALSAVVDFGVLKEHGVEKIFLLESGPVGAGPVKGIIYLVLPDVRKMKMIAEQIRAGSHDGSDVAKEYSLQMVPRRTLLCERVLEEEGVLGGVALGEYRMDFVPLEDDVLSLELPGLFKELYLDGDFSGIQYVARALMRLQGLYGFFPRILGKGDYAHVLAHSLARMRSELSSGAPGRAAGGALTISSVFDSVVIIDRAVDLVTPLLTQLTYEGLLSEVFGIANGAVTVGDGGAAAAGASASASGGGASAATGASEAQQGSGARRRIVLSSSDAVYSEIRDMNFAGVGGVLSKMTRQLQSTYESRHKAKTVQEIRSFVGKLGGLQTEHQSLKAHIMLAETLVRRTQSDDFGALLDIEQALVGGSDLSKEQLAYVDQLLALAEPHAKYIPGVAGGAQDAPPSPPAASPNTLHKVLRVLCLYALWRGPSFKQKLYDAWYEDIVAAFGHHQTVTLDNLARVGLLPLPSAAKGAMPLPQLQQQQNAVQGDGGLLGAGVPSTRPRASAHANPLGFLRRTLNLLPGDMRDDDPDDVSYVYSGYAPISIRLLQCLVHDPAVYTPTSSSRYASLLRPLGDSRTRPAQHDGQSIGGVKGGWGGWDDVLAELPGETVDLRQIPAGSNGGADGDGGVDSMAAVDEAAWRLGEKAPATLVVFLGGCTSTEIAALRRLSQQHNHYYVAATTQLLNGNAFLDPLIQHGS
ncbi:Vacuolar protein-sorting-associated protein 33 [Coemansia biformis]|uniref:Vacuolar protein-sorting-associated protein 33 n=1 Tax=Coemansia biformis TaxID=1286918 RepID=A0A9W7YAS4_9FUNG|nr:Vacuolar protein-sorting-associated protein 33 [Coemansia biformis]